MGWYDLTPRQQELDRKIERSGIKLDYSNSCVRKVMRAIGAASSEEDYVRGRIALRVKAQAAIDDADDFISRTERMLDDFKKDDGKWERK